MLCLSYVIKRSVYLKIKAGAVSVWIAFVFRRKLADMPYTYVLHKLLNCAPVGSTIENEKSP